VSNSAFSPAVLGTLWHDTDLSRPHAIVEVIALERLAARIRVCSGPSAGDELEIGAADLGRRFIPVLAHRRSAVAR
jgi:hypothetical protein